MKGGFLTHALHKRYSYRDFLEPLLALPFGYAGLRILEGQYNPLTFVIVFVLFLVYLPAIVVFTETSKTRVFDGPSKSRSNFEDNTRNK